MSEILSYDDEREIRELLIGRRVVKVHGESCTLDDGTVLKIVANEGCGGCSSGWYELDHLETVDNAITSVDFKEEWNEKTDDCVYSIFVFADAKHINFLSVSGSDGNGYYGTGYRIHVTSADAAGK